MDEMTLRSNGYERGHDKNGQASLRKRVATSEGEELYVIDAYDGFDLENRVRRILSARMTCPLKRASILTDRELVVELSLDVPKDMSLDELEMLFFQVWRRDEAPAHTRNGIPASNDAENATSAHVASNR